MEKLKMEYKVICGNNVDLLKIFPDNHFDSIVTDPPYGLGKEPIASDLMKDWIEKGYHEISGSGFMGKEWDAFVPQPIFWKEVFRVLKPGGHVLAFYGTRTYDWGVMAMRFAGFEVRDCIQWLYGSGFPKSHNISKALDKMEGAEREVVGKTITGGIKRARPDNAEGFSNPYTSGQTMVDITAPSTDSAKLWDGWGTALKPANEPIVLARKPLEKGLSIAENILKWGVGGINIDASRIGSSEDMSNLKAFGSMPKNKSDNKGFLRPWMNDRESILEKQNAALDKMKNLGRYPANIILTHSNYQVMNLVGNIDSSKLAEIIRYFYGYTKVFDLREGKRSTAIKDKCGDEILQFGVQEEITKKGFDTKQDSSELPQLSNTIHNIQEPLSNGKKEILQSNVQRPISEINEGGEGDKIWQKAHNRVEEENGGNENKEWNEFIEGETPKLEGGKNESSRICEYNDFNTSDGLARNSEENATKSNIHFGASDSNGDGNEKTAIGFGECTPHKRDKERQQSKQFSDRGQSETLEEASGNRCGNGKIEKGEPILEVLDFDVPTEWLRYFEYTGENLGCECKGTKKVKPSNGSGKASEKGGGFSKGMFGDGTSDNIGGGFTDADGNETVENWDCHEDCPIRILDEQSGVSKSTGGRIGNKNGAYSGIGANGFTTNHEKGDAGFGDKGGASRFFYCAKASKSERNKGLEDFEEKIMEGRDEGQDERSVAFKARPTPMANIHPTVKPIKLMQYLVKMITPPNGIVLDPFCGSGTTGVACKIDGFQFIGLEQDPEYAKIAEARINNSNVEIESQLKLF